LTYSNRDFRVCSRTGIKEQNGGMNWGDRVVDIPTRKETKYAASAAMNERRIMKQLIYAILGVAVIGGGIALSASRQKNPVVPPAQARTESAPSPATANNPPAQPAVATPVPAQAVPADTGDSRPAAVASATGASAKAIDPAIKQAIDSLLSKQLTHEQRRDILKKLNEAGKLNDTISELQQQAANDPNNAEYQTALGQAYVEQAAAMKDFSPDKGILVMQAMKSFDTALSDDPANWEARFTRTAILSHYPAELNQGQEVINQFTQLINQQEAQPSQAQFAMSYVLLGDQYQKLGQNDYALATWQAGAQLFPSDKTLQKRLAQPVGQ
jgi:tetratricopeptide (TPR) repeat protein